MAYDLYIPDQLYPERALRRTTHLAIGAHADDLEIMAYHGIAACYDRHDLWFGGIVVTDGAGSSQEGLYAQLSPSELVHLRQQEQRKAAELGRYSFVAQLDFSSAQAKTAATEVTQKIASLLHQTQPETLYLHNPADKHGTHIAVLKCCLAALHSLRPDQQPKNIYGCEVWRDLDWLADESKVALDCSPYPELAKGLIFLFNSQISGGKRYDLATLGRRHANATFSDPRQTDKMQALTWALDLSPLLDPKISVESFMQEHLENFKNTVLKSLS